MLRLCSVEDTLSSLSLLAEALITAAYWVCARALRHEHHIPGNALTGFTILAMGKLGGGELNFSSDVDLIYLYASEDEMAVRCRPRNTIDGFLKKSPPGSTISLAKVMCTGSTFDFGRKANRDTSRILSPDLNVTTRPGLGRGNASLF